MEYSECKIGNKVRCMNPKGPLTLGDVYTIVETKSDLIRVEFVGGYRCGGFFYASRFEPVKFEPLDDPDIPVEKDPDALIILGAEHPDKIDWFAINKEFSVR